MEPTIQYATAPDGVNIAFWTAGSGAPLVLTPLTPLGHIQLEWQIPGFRRWYERLAQERMVVSYNARGSGLSDRDPADYTLAAHITDLEAVVDRLGLDSFGLLGQFHSGAVAIAYAARHPERVSHLLLWGAYLRGTDYGTSPRIDASRALLLKDWDAYCETFALFAFGWSDPESARRSVDLIRESASQDFMIRAVQELDQFDVSDVAGKVAAPTLVMQARRAPWPPLDAARRVSAAIPNARLVVVEGDHVHAFGNDPEIVHGAISDFLTLPPLGASVAPAPSETTAPPKPPAGLTERETQLLRLVAAGMSNKEIAAELSVTVNTVERHLVNIYSKIGARGRADATAFALKNDIA
jgi:pimeloyl-ACP methyl ester carboxylesterase/DNA-binding CsgD family transcriptional regulator